MMPSIPIILILIILVFPFAVLPFVIVLYNMIVRIKQRISTDMRQR